MISLPSLTAVLDLLYPPCCIYCTMRLERASTHRWLCDACAATFRYVTPPYCRTCGRSCASTATVCLACQTHTPPFRAGTIIYQYQTALRACLHQVKFSSHRPLARWLGTHLGLTARRYMDPAAYDAIVPVPLHPTRLRDRGFNQAQVLAQGVSMTWQIPLDAASLYRQHATPPQFALHIAKRQTNVAQAFAVRRRHRFHKQRLLLVDDILTTGATANACASTLLGAGAHAVDLLVLASN